MNKVKLGTVLKLHVDEVPIDSSATYPMSGVYGYGRGLMKREPLSGTNTSYKKFHRLHTNDFVLSQLKGWEGAMALVTEEFDGYFLSPQFPTFRTVSEKLDIHYLDWYCKQPKVWAELLSNARGMGARRSSVSPKQFLSLEIPLPPLDEQRRIVARIEALAGRVTEAQRLRVEAVGEVEAVSRAILFSENGWQATPTPMSELVYLQKTDVAVELEQTYEFAGVYSFGRGVFRSQVKTGAEFAYKRLSTVHTGNFVYPKLMAWEGALGIVPPDCDGCVVSPEFPVFEVNCDRVLPEVLDTYFRTKSVWPSLAGNSTGTNARRRRLHPNEFLAYRFPLPPMHVQLKLKAIKDRLKPVTEIQLQTQPELDALLPAILDKAFRGEL